MLAKVRPSARSVASYVWLIKCVGDPVFCAPNIGTGGSLGSPYAPLFVGSADNHPAKPGFRAPDVFAANETPERMRGRRELLDHLEPTSHRGNWGDVHERGFELATASGPRQAFEVNREDPRLRDRYGRNVVGQRCLLARRLVEAGVRLVTVDFPNVPGQKAFSWDDPASVWNIFEQMEIRLPVLDQAVSALIEDVSARGLDRETLVVVMGEMGRTPRLSDFKGQPGREHWARSMSVLLAGGGLRLGQVVGSTNARGEEPRHRPLSPNDLLATWYRALGVPLDTTFTDFTGRPMPILPHGKPIDELV